MKKVERYLSSDGQLFASQAQCAAHEGLEKCEICQGSGKEEYEHRIPYPSGLPDSGWIPDEITIRHKTCTRCDGVGYVKSNLEFDTDYKEYLRLKEKFK